ncbi:MOSC domain-containing protein [Macrophomina phaseolina]|uniref:MOSC domain-containing protein n=1 Tax=Macrophomina phaseolina TaxID=35725 RepID=A0ABQ8GGF2_9PEZI|nr:MOSC domain-containing protein [Macrophomina phaseolina]
MGSIDPTPTDPFAPFFAPWTTDTLTELRTGKTTVVPGTSIPSAIHKRARTGPLHVHTLGVAGDQQTYYKHGGPDKAVMQYCSAHYGMWARELPASAPRFKLGAFGENFVAARMNERNVCIGDVVQVGEAVRLQVSLPRAPCFKLNHRFQNQEMARLSQESSRTGWYYRVLREGEVKAGDELRLVERKYPQWTVHAVQEYLHRDKTNEEAVRELAALPELGEQFRELFQNRLRKMFRDLDAEREDWRLRGMEEDRLEAWKEFTVVGKRRETAKIASFVFEALEPVPEPQKVRPGSHVRVKLGNLIRSYSVVGGDANCLEIGVALDDNSRGGSKHLHDEVKVGDTLTVGRLNESFPLELEAQKHILIAGGIGITAFVPAAQELATQCANWELHLCVRSKDDIPFRRYLDTLGEHLIVHSKADGDRLDILNLIGSQPLDTHVYCCGPQRMMEAVTGVAESLNFPKTNVHFEAFTANLTGDPFEVELKRSGKKVDVPANETLLDVLRDAGFDIPSSCEVGNCATCKVKLLKGRVDHRGTALEDEEKKDSMLCCVSRGVGKIEIEL